MSINKSGYDLFNSGSFVSILMWMLIFKCWMLHKVIVEQKVILYVGCSEEYQIVKRAWLVIALLTMTKVVVNTTIMVVITLGLTTTHHSVVRRITTTKGMWSLYF